ncbi:MAG: hypothetical protein KME35_14155 [Aphanocapsa sp. GSE-SYN-MK-11-07L]|nr:hypothetical protein [Aphanocapsa sp. GSE-SYN-MK-11-07L]
MPEFEALAKPLQRRIADLEQWFRNLEERSPHSKQPRSPPGCERGLWRESRSLPKVSL